jgi:hypothetical protein
MAGHIANLAAERTHMAGHIANLAAERKHLVGHIANLERQQAELSERAHSLRGFKGAIRFVRQALTGPLVRSSLGLNGKQAPESAPEEA